MAAVSLSIVRRIILLGTCLDIRVMVKKRNNHLFLHVTLQFSPLVKQFIPLKTKDLLKIDLTSIDIFYGFKKTENNLVASFRDFPRHGRTLSHEEDHSRE